MCDTVERRLVLVPYQDPLRTCERIIERLQEIGEQLAPFLG